MWAKTRSWGRLLHAPLSLCCGDFYRDIALFSESLCTIWWKGTANKFKLLINEFADCRDKLGRWTLDLYSEGEIIHSWSGSTSKHGMLSSPTVRNQPTTFPGTNWLPFRHFVWPTKYIYQWVSPGLHQSTTRVSKWINSTPVKIQEIGPTAGFKWMLVKARM